MSRQANDFFAYGHKFPATYNPADDKFFYTGLRRCMVSATAGSLMLDELCIAACLYAYDCKHSHHAQAVMDALQEAHLMAMAERVKAWFLSFGPYVIAKRRFKYSDQRAQELRHGLTREERYLSLYDSPSPSRFTLKTEAIIRKDKKNVVVAHLPEETKREMARQKLAKQLAQAEKLHGAIREAGGIVPDSLPMQSLDSLIYAIAQRPEKEPRNVMEREVYELCLKIVAWRDKLGHEREQELEDYRKEQEIKAQALRSQSPHIVAMDARQEVQKQEKGLERELSNVFRNMDKKYALASDYVQKATLEGLPNIDTLRHLKHEMLSKKEQGRHCRDLDIRKTLLAEIQTLLDTLREEYHRAMDARKAA